MNPQPPTAPHRQGPLAPVVHHPRFKWAAVCLALAVIAVPLEASFGGLHAHTPRGKLISLATLLAFVVLAGAGVRVAVSMLDEPPAALPGWASAGLGRQDVLLGHASVVVCGAGHGMLAKALRAGVPVVTVPGGGDQWELANRVARQGSGVVVRPVSAQAVRQAVRRVLADPGFAAGAGKVADPVQVCRRAVGG